MKKFILIVLSTLAVAVVLAAAALPLVVPPIVTNLVRERLSEFGLPADARVKLGYTWASGPALAGTVDVAVLGSPWQVRADFTLACGGLSASVRLPETPFSQEDPVLRKLLEQHPLKAISDLSFSGSVAAEAEASASLLHPDPQWTVRVPLRRLSGSATRDGRKLALDSLSLTARASGIGRHCDIAPLHVRATSFSADSQLLTDIRANLIVSGRSLLLTDATAGFCGGTASLYAMRLDMESLNAGVTFLLDDVEAGEALSRLRGFRGTASGRLHGKVRLFARKGGEALRIREAFLYSVPGETGKIRLRNPDEFSENLALAGLDAETGKNLTDALTDLDYSVLRFNLVRGEGLESTLSTRIAGTAKRGDLSVPVDLTVNLHGELEQFVNRGLEYSNKLKGKRP